MMLSYCLFKIKTSAQDLNDLETDLLYPKPTYCFTGYGQRLVCFLDSCCTKARIISLIFLELQQ